MPVLGVCYGAQLLATQHGATVERGEGGREYGRQTVTPTPVGQAAPLLAPLWEGDGTVWMSHGDAIRASPREGSANDDARDVPSSLHPLAYTDGGVLAAFSVRGTQAYGLQFHPEVTHTDQGRRVLAAFARDICGMTPNWRPEDVRVRIEADLRAQLDARGEAQEVVVAVGGVDSTVTATLLHRVAPSGWCACLSTTGCWTRRGRRGAGRARRAGHRRRLRGRLDCLSGGVGRRHRPRGQAQGIGATFVDTFVDACRARAGRRPRLLPGTGDHLPGRRRVGAGRGRHGDGHQVAPQRRRLPEALPFALVEPLRWLFKDDVRALGAHVGIPPALVERHPFPGPGLAIRVLGEVTPAKVALLQRADKVYIDFLRAHGLYARIWQAGAVLLPVRTVGVQGDARTYEHVVALRAVTSVDGMTAECYPFEARDLAAVATRMIGEVKGVYDESKPPATVEWEERVRVPSAQAHSVDKTLITALFSHYIVTTISFLQ